MEKILTISNVILLITCLILLYIVIKNNAIKEFLGSFNNRDEGMSGRKLTAFGFAVLASYVHYEGFRDRILSVTLNVDKSVTTLYHTYLDQSNITTVLLMDICVTLLALALIKVDDIPFFNKSSNTTVIERNTLETKQTNSTTTTDQQ